MKAQIRRYARKAFRSLGFERRIAPTFADVMKHQAIDIVLDVGANDGDYAREIRDAGYTGRIVSFEPNPDVFARLAAAARHDDKWDVFKLGLGDTDGRLDLSITARDVFSSFKAPSDYGRLWSGTVEQRRENVEVVRLDSFLANNPALLSRTYLKVDTQGFEMEVLRGAGATLRQLKAVQLELGLLRIYADQEDWLSFSLWLRDSGFEVATVSCNSASRREGQIIELDMVFVQRSA